MRCKNCGWENPENLTRCEKCHNDLGNNAPIGNSTSLVSDRMKGTIAESMIFDENTSNGSPKTCPKCGYPLGDNSTSCPNCNYELQLKSEQKLTCKLCGAENAFGAKFCSSCGAPLNEGSPQRKYSKRPVMGTVMGGPVSDFSSKKNFCTLKPIAWEGEEVNYNPITYSGNEIILNRSNTDANNNSITSHEQALLTYEDGEWFIENRSELRTTFIRVNSRMKLTNGDIIVLGDREFEFKG